MKRIASLVALIVLAIVANAGIVSAQTIKPRGSTATTSPAATVTQPPATTATDAPDKEVKEPNKEEAVAQEENAPPVPPVVQLNLDQKLTEDGGYPENYTVRYALARAYNAGGDTQYLPYEVSVLRKRVERANQKLNWLIYGGSAIGALLIGVMTFVVMGLIEGRKKRVSSATTPVVLCILGFGFGTQAQAQTMVAQTPDKPACTIQSITTDSASVVVKEQDAVGVKITLAKPCSEIVVKTVEVLGTPGVSFSEISQRDNVLSGKIAADTSALTGPVAIKLTIEDGTEVVSGDTIYLNILDTATALLRRDVLDANANLRKEFAKAAKEGTSATSKIAEMAKRLEAVEGRVDQVASATYGKTEVEQMLFSLEARLDTRLKNAERVLADTVSKTTTNTDAIEQVAWSVGTLTYGQEKLANKKVGGFLGIGKKPMSPEVAKIAVGVREQMEAIHEQMAAIREGLPPAKKKAEKE